MAMKDKIFQADDRPVERTEDVPEWGVTVGFRVIGGKERSAHERRTMAKSRNGEVIDTAGLRGGLLAATLVDEDEALIFSPADVAALEEKNGVVLDRLFSIAQKVNGFGEDAVEDAEKNSESGPSASSGSSSAPC